jgi:hypothetical protein
MFAVKALKGAKKANFNFCIYKSKNSRASHTLGRRFSSFARIAETDHRYYKPPIPFVYTKVRNSKKTPPPRPKKGIPSVPQKNIPAPQKKAFPVHFKAPTPPRKALHGTHKVPSTAPTKCPPPLPQSALHRSHKGPSTPPKKTPLHCAQTKAIGIFAHAQSQPQQ